MRTIHEKCEYCGERAAWHEGDAILVDHNCDQMPPGPADPPQRYRADRVNFVRAGFTQEQWRKEFDAAWTFIAELQRDRADMALRLRNVKEAVGNWKHWADE